MSKQKYNQRYIYKIKSSRFRNSGWNLTLNLEDARNNDELISLGDSQLLRFIRDIRQNKYKEEDIFLKKEEIKATKKEKTTAKNIEKIKKLYKELDDMVFIEDYIGIVFNSKSDYNRAVKKEGVILNGEKFKRILGTTNGVKKNTVMFCKEEIYKELNRRIENGRDKNLLIIPAKYEAYKSLVTSVSTPVTMPNRILVIKDGTVKIKDKVVKIFDNGKGGFDIDYNYKYEANRDFCDGCGMIRKDLAEQWAIDLNLFIEDCNGNKKASYIPSGFNVRYSFTKGMVFTFPFDEFAKEVGEYIVEDAWGNKVDIREVDLILTTNMFKLYNAYRSMEDFLDNCNKNKYEFCVGKVIDKKLENKRNTNYQYLQSYDDMTDNDIKELAKETVDEIKGALGEDYRKAILFSKGIHINKKNISNSDYDFIRALMIDKRMINDSFVKQKLYGMIEKRIREAKKGVLTVDGNYSIISGDLYALCESMFKLDIKGLLGFGEFYNEHWLNENENEIIAFRSPMTSHNNIRRMKLKDNKELRKWYRYMPCVTVVNAHDTTCEALNGADMDD